MFQWQKGLGVAFADFNCNVTAHFAKDGQRVTLINNFSQTHV